MFAFIIRARRSTPVPQGFGPFSEVLLQRFGANVFGQYRS